MKLVLALMSLMMFASCGTTQTKLYCWMDGLVQKCRPADPLPPNLDHPGEGR